MIMLDRRLPLQSSQLILAGVTIAAASFAGRYLLRNRMLLRKAVEALPGDAFSKYYRGGFEAKMSRREAAMILGVPPTAKPNRIKEAHKRIMIANHPDREYSMEEEIAASLFYA
uniref:DnaJ homolog subfamily C member 21 n=1 Tax=Parascaris equorum TaxID=6256 RepID=A0A914SG63_PAREQ